jgi:ribonuclease HI
MLKNNFQKFIVHTDGGSRGNPGPAAVGVVITDGAKKTIQEFGKRIGETTNNVAEYTAVIEALNALKKTVGESPVIEFYLDSTLVVNQLNGLFKIKDMRLRSLATSVRILEQEVGGVVTYTSVPREQNKRADFMVNQALDA